MSGEDATADGAANGSENAPRRVLTDTERAILTREHKSAFTSERLPPIFDEFGILPDVYFARLSKLIDREDVLAEFPVLVRHLRRVREGRKRSRGLGG